MDIYIFLQIKKYLLIKIHLYMKHLKESLYGKPREVLTAAEAVVIKVPRFSAAGR